MRLSLFKSKTDVVPQPIDNAWSHLIKRVRDPHVRADKDGPLVSPAHYDPPKRGNENVKEISALSLDLDHGVPPIDEVQQRLHPFHCAFVVYSTHSHERKTESNPQAERRLRVFIPLDPVVPVDKFAALREYVIEYTKLPADRAASAPSQMYYLPVKATADAPYECVVADGEPLDWTKLDLPLHHRPKLHVVPTNGNGVIPQGQRDNALTSIAGSMRTRGLDSEEIAAALKIVNQKRCQPPLPDGDIIRIARSVERYEPAANNFAHLPSRENAGVEIPTPDGAAIQAFAELSPLEYDRRRKAEALKLGVRPATLDKLVTSLRAKSESDLQGRKVELQDVELWPEPVVGAEVLNEVSETFSNYVALPPGAADLMAVWRAHAHVYDVFTCSPRLNITSPEKRCGKTLTRDVIREFVPRPLSTENMTVAVLFRVIESRSPTVLADEYDTWVFQNEDLRGCLNSGHRRGGQVYRCEGDGNEVRGFTVFAPVVLCGIGALPGTLDDRSIKVSLARAKRDEVKKRFDSRHTEREQELCQKLARWCADNRSLIESCDPALPKSAFNRVADNWRSLFSVARVAGGEWPKLITDAFAKLVSSKDVDDQGINTMLLGDIREVFKGNEMFSCDLVSSLTALSDRPWPEANKGGKPITERWLARHLRGFKIYSGDVHKETGHKKGYKLADFADSFARYLDDPEKTASGGLSDRANVQIRINTGESENPNRADEDPAHDWENAKSPINIDFARLHDWEAPAKDNNEPYREPTKAEWDEAAKDPDLWDRLVIAAERAAIESEGTA